MKVDDEEDDDHTPDWKGWTDRESNIFVRYNNEQETDRDRSLLPCSLPKMESRGRPGNVSLVLSPVECYATLFPRSDDPQLLLDLFFPLNLSPSTLSLTLTRSLLLQISLHQEGFSTFCPQKKVGLRSNFLQSFLS